MNRAALLSQHHQPRSIPAELVHCLLLGLTVTATFIAILLWLVVAIIVLLAVAVATTVRTAGVWLRLVKPADREPM